MVQDPGPAAPLEAGEADRRRRPTRMAGAGPKLRVALSASPHRELEQGPGVGRRVVAVEGYGVEAKSAEIGLIAIAERDRPAGEPDQRRDRPVAGRRGRL